MSKAKVLKDRDPEVTKSFLTSSTGKILLLASWFGILSGFSEATYLIFVERSIRHRSIQQGIETLWMAPVAELLVFLIIGSALALLARGLPKIFSQRVIIILLAFLFFIASFILLPPLHVVAKLALALGLAVQTERIIRKHQSAFFTLVKRTLVPQMVIVLGLAVGIPATRKIVERHNLGTLPPAQAASPNVIFITLDTVRARNMSLYGYQRKTTPYLDELAKKGVVFDRAVATAPWTLPSHASMFTGLMPEELSFSWTKLLRLDRSTLGEELTHRGYETAGFVANLVYCSREQDFTRGLKHFEDYEVNVGQLIMSSSLAELVSNVSAVRELTNYYASLNRKTASDVRENFVKWVTSRDQDRPFFAFLNFFDAHDPLLPPAPFDTKFGPAQDKKPFEYNGADISPRDPETWKPEDIQKNRDAYDSAIAYLDSELGKLFEQLNEQHQLDNTVVIITSDHGHLLWEHKIFGHGNSLYADTVHVPLVIVYPSHVPVNTRIEQAVSLRDLPMTVLDLVEQNQNQVFPGKSLARYWNRTDTADDEAAISQLEQSPFAAPVPNAAGPMRSVVKGHFHYILNGNKTEELYDLRSDPEEMHNLANTAGVQKELQKAREAISSEVARKY